MKLSVATLFAIAAADEKKVPPRHPLQRLKRLNQFANEWIGDNLTQKQAANWGPKFNRNTKRFERRWEICEFYDENQLPHGGPAPDRKRRDDDDDDSEFERYDKGNPIRGIRQITRGYQKWAERYVSGCKLQPATQSARADKWYGKLVGKLAENNNL